MAESKKLLIELNSSLSYNDFIVYYIVFNENKIGYLGVFTSNGKFNYSVKNELNNYYFLSLIKAMIQKELRLNPILNPCLY